MERKYTVAEFATLVGTSPKTIYGRIDKYEELPENEKLLSVREKVNGREVVLIVADDYKINLYKDIYGNNPVKKREYYESVTDNYSYKPYQEFQEPVKNNNNEGLAPDVFDRIMTLTNEYNSRLEQKINEILTVERELAEVKGRQLYLEDKAGREGLYIGEINQLKKEKEQVQKLNNRLKLIVYLLITFIVVIFTVAITIFSVNSIKKTAEVTTPPQVELLDEKENLNQPSKPHYNRNQKR